MTDVPVAIVSETVPAEPGRLRSFAASVSTVLAKEARWRMRGRRAFVVVTIYLTLLGLLVLGVYRLLYERTLFTGGFDGPMPALDMVSGSTSAGMGQAIFTAILGLQTVLTLMLAPALTSGAISVEREKQTLELLITTPVSTLGLVVGKLLSSLAYVFLLIVASVPLMSIAFVFGGVGPEDVVRAYIVLFAVAFGVGSIGLFLSAIFKRTQVSTAVAYVVVFALTIGALILHTYLVVSTQRFDEGLDRPTHHAPEALHWLNPIVTDIDLLCTSIPDTFGFACSYIAGVTSQEFNFLSPPRDSFWPRSTLAFLALGTTLTLLTTQLIAPSRRFNRRRPRRIPAETDAEPAAAPTASPTASP
jgi:ABC-type transport system involved in multi-copper enzyme maturation permease subunit